MVSVVDTGLIIRANSAFIGPAFGRNDDETSPFSSTGNRTADTAGAPNVGGLLPSAAISAFGNGEERQGADEGPFFVSGLNGLLAPPSIATVQEENGASGDEDSGSEPRNGIAQPSEPTGDGTPDAAAAEGEEEEPGAGELTEEEQETVDDLKQRDAEVRRHEQAHKAVGGQYAGSISYTYESGPDGNRYAVGGEVPIDASPIAGDPEATIRKLQQVRSAALAPAEPSGADRAIAAQASQGIQQARAEQVQESAEELEEQFQGDEETAGVSSDVAADNGAGDAPAADAGPQAGANGTPPFGADGSGADGEPGSAFSVRSIGEGASDGGPFEQVRSGDRGADLFGDRSERVSPFDFSPSAGRVTLDISV